MEKQFYLMNKEELEEKIKELEEFSNLIESTEAFSFIKENNELQIKGLKKLLEEKEFTK